MEIGSVRPVLTGVTTPVPRAPAESKQTTSTEIPARAAVTETASGSDNAQSEAVFRKKSARAGKSGPEESTTASTPPKTSQAKSDPYKRDIERDPSTNVIVFRTIDVQSGDVVQQVPEESQLRMHRMIAAWKSGAGNATQQSSVDIST